MRTDVLHSKILYSVLALMLATALLPLVFVGWRLIAITKRSMAEGQMTTQILMAERRAAEVSGIVERAVTETRAVARGLEIGDRARTPVDLRGMIAGMEGSESLRALMLERPPARRDVLDRGRPGVVALDALVDEARGALAPGRPVVLTVGSGAATELVVAEPMAPSGMVLAVYDLSVALAGLGGKRAAEAAGLEPDLSGLSVVDDLGTLIAGPEPELIGAANPRDRELVAAWIAAPAGSNPVTREFEAQVSGRDLALLGAIASVELPGGRRLGVVAVADPDLAIGPANRIALQTLIACVFAAFVALLVAILFTSQIATPLSELARGARAIASGDFSHRIRARSGNEIGQLAGDFNRMADQLQKNMERMRDTADTSRALFIGTVRGLAAAIDGKDPYTRGHSERVAEYSAAMAAELGLSEDEVEKVRISGLMHDIGKLAIEDKILRKPASLTNEEFEIMREHPERGTRIMSEIPQMREYIPGMRFHHEMVNGKGYPLGLAGDQIPLQAKIVCVADTFDAMTTNRPYQKQMPIDLVFEKIREMAGIRYDPRVVDALVGAYENGRIKIRLQKPVRPGLE